MFYRCLAVLMSGFLCSIALADTQKVSSTSYGVTVVPPEATALANGTVIMNGGLFHASSVDDNGDVNSQWCRGSNAMGDNGQPVAGGGFCTIVSQTGDLLWVWFGGGKWGVISGTGEWAGATGGGTSEPVSQSPDGFAYVNKSSGSITSK